MDDEKYEEEGVGEDSPASSDSDSDVETDEEKEAIKAKNFEVLRRLKKESDEKNKVLEKELAAVRKAGAESRDLNSVPTEDPSKEENQTLKFLFERDKKAAVRRWSRDNPNISDSEWKDVQKKVVLSGDETMDEIIEKINEAHNTLPGVRASREKELIEKGRKEAMKQIRYSEMDLGGGGDPGYGDGSSEPRFTPKEKKFLNSMGVNKEEMKNIDKSKPNHGYDILDPKFQD